MNHREITLARENEELSVFARALGWSVELHVDPTGARAPYRYLCNGPDGRVFRGGVANRRRLRRAILEINRAVYAATWGA